MIWHWYKLILLAAALLYVSACSGWGEDPNDPLFEFPADMDGADYSNTISDGDDDASAETGAEQTETDADTVISSDGDDDKFTEIENESDVDLDSDLPQFPTCNPEQDTEYRDTEINCGLNNRGYLQQQCLDGFWRETGTCRDPDACIDDTTQEGACGLFDRGIVSQLCYQGQWVMLQDCDDPSRLELVADLNQTQSDFPSLPEGYVVLNGDMILNVYTADTGYELGIIDDADEFRIIKDIRPGPESSSPQDWQVSGNRLFYTADDGIHGRELWVTDGTALGTRLVFDAHPGPEDGTYRFMVDYGGLLLFQFGDNYSEIWISDGTESGTRLFFDSHRIDGAYAAREPVAVGGKLFLELDHIDHGDELWVVDSPEDEPRFVHRAWDPSDPDSTYHISQFWRVGNRLYFRGYPGYSSDLPAGLWCSDGTRTGTRMVLASEENWWNYPSFVKALGGRAIIGWRNEDPDISVLYHSDGTPESTERIYDGYITADSAYYTEAVRAGGLIYFVGSDAKEGYELWRTDGTAQGTFSLGDFASPKPGDAEPYYLTEGMTPYYGGLATVFDSRDFGKQVLFSDGSREGTRILSDFSNTDGDGAIWDIYLAASGDSLYILTRTKSAYHLYRSVGAAAPVPQPMDTLFAEASYLRMETAGNRVLITGKSDNRVFVAKVQPNGQGLLYWHKAKTNPSDPQFWTMLNGRLLFSAMTDLESQQLFITDGTPFGTLPLLEGSKLLKDVSFTDVSYLGRFGYEAVFTCRVGAYSQLCITDGRPDGTRVISEMLFDGPSSNISGFADIGSHFIFTANSEGYGRELFRSDGTASGTTIISDFDLQDDAYFDQIRFSKLCSVGSNAVFSVELKKNREESRQLWVSNGEHLGTRVLIDFSASNGSISIDRNVVCLDDVLLFLARHEGSDSELWRSDGTEAGTYPLTDFTQSDSRYFFSDLQPGGDGRAYFVVSNDIWQSDGTIAGTAAFTKIDRNEAVPYLLSVARMGEWLYFAVIAIREGQPLELWKARAGSSGPSKIVDTSLAHDHNRYYLQHFTPFPPYLLFTTDPYTVYQWRSDGSTAGTVPMFDTGTRTRYCAPTCHPETYQIIPDGNRLFITYDSPEEGVELFTLTP